MSEEKYYITYFYKKHKNQDEYCKVIIGKIEEIKVLELKMSFFIPINSFDFNTYRSGKKKVKKMISNQFETKGLENLIYLELPKNDVKKLIEKHNL